MHSKEGRLFNFFSILNKSEHRRFPIWLEMELDNHDKEMWKWFRSIWKVKDMREAWKRLYPDEAFNKSRISKWNHRILEKLELFLAIESFKEEAFLPKLYLNRFTLRRAPIACFHDSIRKSRRQIRNQKIRDYTYYEIQHQLDRHELEYKYSYPNRPIRRHKINPQEVKENYTLSLLLRQMEVILNRFSGQDVELDEGERQVIRQLESFSSLKEQDLAKLFVKIYGAYSQQGILSKESTEELIDFYQESFKQLRPDSQYSMFLHLYNCMVRSQNKSTSAYHIGKLLELCKWFYDIRKDIYMRSTYYSNHTKIYIRLAEGSKNPNLADKYLTNAENMIEASKAQLEPTERQDVYLYNIAMLHFTRSEFRALETLASDLYRQGGFSMRDIHQELSFEHLYAKCLYELGEDQEYIAALLKSIISKTSASKKLGQREKEFYAGRSKFFKQMVYAKSTRKIEQLKNKLTHTTAWLDQNWFVKKLEEKRVPE